MCLKDGAPTAHRGAAPTHWRGEVELKGGCSRSRMMDGQLSSSTAAVGSSSPGGGKAGGEEQRWSGCNILVGHGHSGSASESSRCCCEWGGGGGGGGGGAEELRDPGTERLTAGRCPPLVPLVLLGTDGEAFTSCPENTALSQDNARCCLQEHLGGKKYQ